MDSSYYHFINVNRGVLSAYLQPSTLLLAFPFTSKTESLKQAVIKADEECVSTAIVDELLRSDVEVIEEFIKTLNNNRAAHLSECFHTKYDESDKIFYDFMHADECNDPVPPNAKLHQNIDNIIPCFIKEKDTFVYALAQLFSIGAFSYLDMRKIQRIDSISGKSEATKALLAKITNKYQYDALKTILAYIHSNAVQYV